MSAARANIHATALVLGDRGVLIRGASGSGKTTLALALIHDARLRGRHAALVADDQLFIKALSGRLIVLAPLAIEGLAEVFGLGPRRIEFRSSASVDLVVDLVHAADAPRLQEAETAEIGGVLLPRLVLADRATLRAAFAVAAWLGWPPFGV